MVNIKKIAADNLTKQVESVIIRDAEKVRSGEEAEAEIRSRDIEDGVDLAVAPGDVETGLHDEKPESAAEIDFEDRESENEDHGRALV